MPEVLSADAPGVAEAMHTAFNPPVKAPDAVPAAPAPATPPPETPPATPAKPEATPAAATPAVPAAKKEFTDDEIAAARKEKPDHKAWKILDSVKARFSQTETQLKAELAKVMEKPQTPANDAKIEQLQKLLDEKDGEVKTWKQRVEEADFTRSEEYTTKYVQPYQTEKRRALDEVKKLTFKFVDPEGNPQTRPATEADFEKAMSLGASEQDEFLEAAFGKSAWRITSRINELERIRSASIQATQDFSANYEKNKVARELEAKNHREKYERELSESYSGFQKDPELGRYLTEAETDPEGTKLYKTALDKYDNFRNVQPTAADVAEVRAAYAMKPRLIHEVKQLTGKVASLEAELAKFRGADPGAPIKAATGATQPDEELGVEGKIKAMSWNGKAS